ncbi:MAG: hypothetical protein GY869_28830 [Planctomycetes bacterium]|nr:hypothetical protein [Planctomycetota bacterium]
MREYRQLTEEDRIEIYAMKQAAKSFDIVSAFIICNLRSSNLNIPLT